MAVRKRGDSWQVDVSHKGHRRSATEATKEAAKATEVRLGGTYAGTCGEG